MIVLVFKSVVIWLVLMITAVANAAIREKLLVPVIGSGISLPVSGLLLSILIFLVVYVSLPFFGNNGVNEYLLIGISWFTLTIVFEFLFGSLVAGKSWYEILQVFNIFKGNLFILALISTLISPWLSAKLRGLI